MSDQELQPSDDLQPDVPEQQEPDSAPEQKEQKVEFNEQQQKVMNDVIGQKTFKIREAERKAEDLQKQLEEAKAKIPQEQKPLVPELPDQFDDDFVEKMGKRDEALQNLAAFDARQSAFAEQRVREAQDRQIQQQQTLANNVQDYSERASKLEISPEKLQQAGAVVAAYGLNDDLVNFIITDEKGPLITTYLANNPSELETLRTMSPLQQSAHIASNIKVKATAPISTSEAPAPVDSLSGGGVPSTGRGPKGATFE